jgi:hypothetical protein
VSTIADQRVHGTTHERPSARFAREHLTPLGLRPSYQYDHVRQRRVPADALVAIVAGRRPRDVDPLRHFSGSTRIAHKNRARFAVVTDLAHYAGLFRPGARGAAHVATALGSRLPQLRRD